MTSSPPAFTTQHHTLTYGVSLLLSFCWHLTIPVPGYFIRHWSLPQIKLLPCHGLCPCFRHASLPLPTLRCPKRLDRAGNQVYNDLHFMSVNMNCLPSHRGVYVYLQYSLCQTPVEAVLITIVFIERKNKYYHMSKLYIRLRSINK